jgi:hypothetical protein
MSGVVDGSIDGSVDLCAHAFPFVTLLPQTTRGAPTARSTGLALARSTRLLLAMPTISGLITSCAHSGRLSAIRAQCAHRLLAISASRNDPLQLAT